jgi:hypothetical protein
MYFLLPLLIGFASLAPISLSELKHLLSDAEQSKQQIEKRILAYKSEIARKEMALIKTEIEKCRLALKRNQPPKSCQIAFLQGQREILQGIIKNLPDCKSEAITLNEELLSFITEIANLGW